MSFATGRKPLRSQLQLSDLQLSLEELEGVHSEDLNYLSSVNEMGKVGVGRPKPREVKWLAQGHTAHSVAQPGHPTPTPQATLSAAKRM